LSREITGSLLAAADGSHKTAHEKTLSLPKIMLLNFTLLIQLLRSEEVPVPVESVIAVSPATVGSLECIVVQP
jgi:hypothetical protein